MYNLKEDILEEEEFQSLTPYEQQRYNKKVQEINKCFQDILTDFKKKWDNEKYIIDIQALEDHKEQFDDHLSNWRYKISIWKERKSQQKKLSARLEQEVENYLNKYMMLYSSILEELKGGKKKGNFYERNDEELEPESEGEMDDVVTKLENQIKELHEQVEMMYKANKLVGDNMDIIKQKNVTLIEQNKNLQGENMEYLKLKEISHSQKTEIDDLTVKSSSLESIIKSLLSCDQCGESFTDKTEMKHHITS